MSESMTAAEYSDSVREWLVQAYQWQAITYTFPTYLAYQASVQQQNNSQGEFIKEMSIFKVH